MAKLYPKDKPKSVYLKKYFLFLIAVFFTQYLFAQPTISGFSPLSGPIGSTVSIMGSNFDPTPANNIVYFGAVRATVHSGNTGAITVDVPAGATYQPISVTTNNLTAYSRFPFTVTFAGGGATFAPNAFSAPKISGVQGNSPTNTLTGDLNGDGKPDVVAVQPGSNTLTVYTNGTSGGTFYFSSINYISVGGTVVAAALADLDGDGKLDIVATNYAGFYNVYVLRNTSSGSSISFTSPGSQYPTGSGTSTSYPKAIAITDLDGDGKPDLAIANSDSTITVYKNNSTAGALSFTNRQNYTIGGGALSIAAGDLDGDGKPDLISANKSANTVSVLKNTSVPGTISLASKIDITPGSGPCGVAIADLDGDGKLDFGVVNATDKKLVLFRNTGTTGTIAFTADTATYSSGTWPPNGIAISDLDGDGKPDVAVSNTDPTTLNLTTTYSVLAFKNASTSGRVSFTPAASYPAGYSMYSVSLGDLNGDGKPDIVTSDVANKSFCVLLNQVQAPRIHSFSPTSAGTGTTVQINGVALTGITSVSFGGTPAQSITHISDTAIAAVVGAGASGLVTIAGSNGADTLAGFTYILPSSPHIISFTPDSAGANDTVTIRGARFTGATAVKFGGIAAHSFTLLTDSSILAIVGTGASGLVKVTTPGGTDSLAGFTFVDTTTPAPPPHITYFTPDSAKKNDTIGIIGTHFTGATAVKLGGTAASSFAVVSDSFIWAVVGNGASGAVKVTTPGGTDSLAGFTFIGTTPPAPHIFSFSPTSARTSDTVTIRGTHFTSATTVKFGGTTAASFTVLSDSLLWTVVGTGASGAVKVTTPGGTDSLAGFTFIGTTPSAPHIFSFSPTSARTGDTVMISGAYFNGTTSVKFGGTAAAYFTVLSDSLLWTVVGTGASGAVKVTTPGGTDSLAGFTFIDTTTPPPAVFKLIQFTGTSSSNQPLLQWGAIHDQKITYYVVEHGNDSSHLTAVSSIKARGQEYGVYTFTDPTPRTGINYYRLKIEDTTGNFTYSWVIAIHLTGILQTLTGYPNPAIGSITIAPPNTSASSQFELTDMMGKIIKTIPVSPNTPQVRIDFSGVVEGVYKLIWSDGSNYSYQTILIKK